MKIYTNELGHMTNMAAMPIYGKILKGCSTYDPGLTLTHFMPKSNLVTLAFVWEKKKKIINFLESIVASGLKVDWSIQLTELMKLCVYQRSRSFSDLGQRPLRFQSLNLFYSGTLGWFGTKVHMKANGRMRMKIYTNQLGHLTNMSTVTI